MDFVIRDASVIDGSGAAPQTMDVGIEQGRLRLGPNLSANQVIDGNGLTLTPGFIDVHTHDDFAAVIYPDMNFKVSGGVTSCVVGNCGMGAAPFAAAQTFAGALHPNKHLPPWDGYAGYLQLLEEQPPSVNIGALVGHGTVRLSVMNNDRREPTQAELGRMKRLVEEGLDAGALGFSSGLVYDPGRFAATEELIELAATMGGRGGLYATHMRDEGVGLLDSIDEAIAIGQRAGVAVQISHHKASGKPAWGLVKESLIKIEQAQNEGFDIHADQYPYTAGSTILSAIYRDGHLGGEREGLTAGDVVIASAQGHANWEGKSVQELSQEMQLTVPVTCETLLNACPGITIILHTMQEDDVRLVMAHPSTMIGSDGLPTLDGKPHPRLYGTFARVLGHYCRDLGVFSLCEAVYRMTGFPAAKFGLNGRGVIADGAQADLVLFDADRIVDKGTFSEPNQSPAGINRVWVNGILTIIKGKHTGERAGKTLRLT